jgi:sec-independent protein translocase protein TatA
MGGFSIWHILIFAIILLLLFGGNRFSAMMGDVAKGLKSFKAGMADEDEDKRRRYDEQRKSEPRQLPRDDAGSREPIDVTPRPPETAAPPPPRDDEAR